MSSQPMATWTPRSSRSVKFVGTRTCRHTMGLIPVSQNLTCRFASVSAAGFSSGTGLRPSLFRPDYRLACPSWDTPEIPMLSCIPRRLHATRRPASGALQRDAFGKSLMAVTRELSAPDDRTLRFHLTKPFPHLLSALAGSSTTMRCIMPECLATTDPFRQVTEMVGSGPYRFLPTEFNAGERAAYERFTGYLPRGGPKQALVHNRKVHA